MARCNNRFRWLAWMGAVALLCGCNGDTSPRSAESRERLQVVSTVGMVADLVEHVGGDRVESIQLIGPGTDPHLYTARTNDVRQLQAADAVFYCGLLLEGKMTEHLESVGKDRPVVAVTKDLPPEVLLAPEESTGHFDPHVWMDVSAWSQGIDRVVKTLSELRPDRASEFAERAQAYSHRLEHLDQYAREVLATIPAENRVLITSHDAFNYFGRAYDLEVLGIQGLSTESEAGLRRVNELVDLLVERRVPAVFVESSVPEKSIQALIDGAAARGHSAVNGGMLYSDAMGAKGTPEGTYIGMIEHNINTVTRALGGRVPADGFAGFEATRTTAETSPSPTSE